jgi:hypothetical protein
MTREARVYVIGEDTARGKGRTDMALLLAQRLDEVGDAE